MAKRSDERYPDAAALTADLDRYAADEPVSAYVEPFSARLWRLLRRRRQAATLLSAAAVLAIGFVLAGILLRSERLQRESVANARLAEAREAALTAERLALDRVRASDFSSAADAFAEAAKSIEPLPSLDEERLRLLDRHDRSKRLADFYRLHDRIWRLNYHEYDDEVQETIPIALELLGLATSDLWEGLPEDELTEVQRRQLREDAHGLMLIQSITLAKAVHSDFHRTSKVKEAKEALKWCARTQKHQATQTIGLLEIVLKYSTGEINPLFVPIAMRLLPIRHPQTPTDFHCMGVLHQMLADAKVLSSNPKAKDVVGADLWTFLSFVRSMTGSGLDLENPQLASQRNFREVVRLEQRRYWAYIFLGSGLLNQNDFMGAELAFNTCVTLRPTSPEGYAGRAGSLFRQSERIKDEAMRKELDDRCRRDLDTALKLGSHSGEIRFSRTDILLRLPGGLDQGIEEMAAFVEAERPLRNLKGHWNYSMYRRKLEMVAEAAQLRRKGAPAAIVPQILALHALGKSDEALALTSEIPADKRGDGRIEAFLGELAFAQSTAQGDATDAEALKSASLHFENALRDRPDHFGAGIGLARIAARVDSPAAGLSRLDAMLARTNAWAPWQHLELLLLRAEWSKAIGRDDDAQDAIRRAGILNLASARKAATRLGLDKP